MDKNKPQNVLVIIGARDMGLPIARRLGSGRHIFLSSFTPSTLSTASQALLKEGHVVTSHLIDITSYDSVAKVASAAAALGHIDAIINTAGVVPGFATAKQIYETDLLGTANIIDAFLPCVSAGTSMVCISSMAGSVFPLSLELETHLATAPLDQLLIHPEIDLKAEGKGAALAYCTAKRGNILRVQAASLAYGKKGARINSLSPGVIQTGSVQDLWGNGKFGEGMRATVEGSAVGRVGTMGDVCNAVSWLVSRESSFVMGIDLLVDGGGLAGHKWGENKLTRESS